MTKVRLDELKAALEQRRPTGGKTLSEADYKRRLVAEIKRLPDGYARRIEDRWAVGVLDMILKLPGHNVILAEGKLINGFLFAPTAAQFEEGKKWEAANVQCLLIGWKAGQMYVSDWREKADCRECFTIPALPESDALMEFLE